jgi:hypothetical protein
MARTPQASKAVDQVRPYLQGVVKKLVDDVYGPKGPAWGTRLTEMEDTINAIREELSRTMLSQALVRQAETTPERPPEYQLCPSCSGPVEPVPKEEGDEPRILDTHSGVAEWPETETHCHRCRRSFFPSVEESRH